MGEQGFHALAVVFGGVNAGAIGGAVDDGAGDAAPGAIAHPRRLADDLLHAREDEALELELGHGFEPLGRHAHRHPGDEPFGQRRIDDPLEPEFIAKPHGGAKHTAVDPHILPQYHHIRIACHLVVQRQIDRFEQRDIAHSPSPLCCMPLAMMRWRWAR